MKAVLLFFTLGCIAVYADRTLLLIGPTRVGKDSFIRTVCGGEKANPGKVDTYMSTTKVVELYQCEVKSETWTIFNVPGFNDNTLQLTDDDIKRKIQVFLIEHSELISNKEGKIDTILLFESLTA